MALGTFGELPVVVLTKLNLFELKLKLFAEFFSKNSTNLDDSGISLPVSPSRTNLKLHNISVTQKWLKRSNKQ